MNAPLRPNAAVRKDLLAFFTDNVRLNRSNAGVRASATAVAATAIQECMNTALFAAAIESAWNEHIGELDKLDPRLVAYSSTLEALLSSFFAQNHIMDVLSS